jgi:hypothetical protein
MERLIAFATQKRKYICRNCGHIFRASDRRQFEGGVRRIPKALPDQKPF